MMRRAAMASALHNADYSNSSPGRLNRHPRSAAHQQLLSFQPHLRLRELVQPLWPLRPLCGPRPWCHLQLLRRRRRAVQPLQRRLLPRRRRVLLQGHLRPARRPHARLHPRGLWRLWPPQELLQVTGDRAALLQGGGV